MYFVDPKLGMDPKVEKFELEDNSETSVYIFDIEGM